jgi:soluble lytic murein transglycosylase-like protein
MKSTQALLAVAAGGLLGLAGGLVAGSTAEAGGSPLAVIIRWAHLPLGMTRTAALENRLRELQERTAALDTLQNQLDDLQSRVDRVDGGKAFLEAKRLGIIAAVAESRPELRPSAVRRMGVAIISEARKNAIDPLLLTAVARVESGFNPFATSDAGAMGVLQLKAPTGRSVATAQGASLGTAAELYDIETNIALGARYLADLMRQFDSPELALLAYNRGAGGARAVLKTDDGPRALQGYPRMVLSERSRLAERAARLQDMPL